MKANGSPRTMAFFSPLSEALIAAQQCRLDLTDPVLWSFRV